MDRRTERIVLETARYRITGDLTLPQSGYRSRLSDYLNRGDHEFVPLADALIESLERGTTERREFLAVSRRHIQVAYEADAT